MKINFLHKDFQLNGISFSSSNDVLKWSKQNSLSAYGFLQDWFSDSDFIRVKTSGSTGKPKQIEIRKKFMINSALATRSYFDLPERTTALCCLPINFIAGKMMLVRALTLGWHLDVVEPNSKLLSGIKKRYDFSAMTPMQLSNSIDTIDRICKLIVGGGVVSSQLEDTVQDVSTEIFATYGMTETVTHIAVKKLNHFSFREGALSEVEEGARNFYQTLPNISISKDKRDCLIIDAPKVSSERIITNDIVELKSDSEFEWLGRFDNVINSGGIKLHPEQIEKKLSSVISQRFFTAGIPDERLGEKLILVVETGKSNVASEVAERSRSEIEESLRDSSLTKYEIPKEIFFVDKFVETETKKIQRSKTLDLVFD